MRYTPQVSTFHSVSEITPTDKTILHGTLSQDFSDKIKNDIRSLRDLPLDEYRQKRNELIPAFTSSGVFNLRNNSGLKIHSQIVGLDFDKLEGKVDTLKEKSSKADFVFGAMISLGGEGLKVFCKTDRPTTQANHKSVYNYLADQLAFGVKVDSASAISQLCFFSVDPHPYLNPTCEAFPIPNALPNEKDSNQVDNHKPENTEKSSFQPVDQKAVEEVLDRLENQRNSDKFQKLMRGISESEDKSFSGVDFSICTMVFFYLKSEYWGAIKIQPFR